MLRMLKVWDQQNIDVIGMDQQNVDRNLKNYIAESGPSPSRSDLSFFARLSTS